MTAESEQNQKRNEHDEHKNGNPLEVLHELTGQAVNATLGAVTGFDAKQLVAKLPPSQIESYMRGRNIDPQNQNLTAQQKNDVQLYQKLREQLTAQIPFYDHDAFVKSMDQEIVNKAGASPTRGTADDARNKSEAAANLNPADAKSGATTNQNPADAKSGATTNQNPADAKIGATAQQNPVDATSGATANQNLVEGRDVAIANHGSGGARTEPNASSSEGRILSSGENVSAEVQNQISEKLLHGAMESKHGTETYSRPGLSTDSTRSAADLLHGISDRTHGALTDASRDAAPGAFRGIEVNGTRASSIDGARANSINGTRTNSIDVTRANSIDVTRANPADRTRANPANADREVAAHLLNSNSQTNSDRSNSAHNSLSWKAVVEAPNLILRNSAVLSSSQESKLDREKHIQENLDQSHELKAFANLQLKRNLADLQPSLTQVAENPFRKAHLTELNTFKSLDVNAMRSFSFESLLLNKSQQSLEKQTNRATSAEVQSVRSFSSDAQPTKPGQQLENTSLKTFVKDPSPLTERSSTKAQTGDGHIQKSLSMDGQFTRPNLANGPKGTHAFSADQNTTTPRSDISPVKPQAQRAPSPDSVSPSPAASLRIPESQSSVGVFNTKFTSAPDSSKIIDTIRNTRAGATNFSDKRFILGSEIALAVIIAAAGATRIRAGQSTGPNVHVIPGGEDSSTNVSALEITKENTEQSVVASKHDSEQGSLEASKQSSEQSPVMSFTTDTHSNRTDLHEDRRLDRLPMEDNKNANQKLDPPPDAQEVTEPNKGPASSTKKLYRPKKLVASTDTLQSIAEAFFYDKNICWLIADINRHTIIEHSMEGKRVIELRTRQQLELPLPEEVEHFSRTRPNHAIAENLVTIVEETAVDRELVNETLKSLLSDDD